MYESTKNLLVAIVSVIILASIVTYLTVWGFPKLAISDNKPQIYESVGAEMEGSMAKCYFKQVYGHQCIWCYKNGGSRIDSAVGSLSCDWNK